ncbi:hypothetical protein C8R41DRAFT_921707 [Lentinula lateritia]|uniref:C2H2-type domain-containing protein n=1 Tax=Lentinula lateritia TaxID=40482 RepID=A0ABQ8VAJ3_9AGAR|nr:hypothetical protein C8R41DRAFT_921707 [Lentinula lateritia]
MPAQARLKDHACSYCGKEFATLQGLRSHTSQVTACQMQSKKAIDVLPKSGRVTPDNEQHQSMPNSDLDPPNSATAHEKRPYVEEVDNVTSTYNPDWIYKENYPYSAGTPVQPCQTAFEIYRERQKAEGSEPWEPF